MGRGGRYNSNYRGTYSTRSRRGRYNSNNSSTDGSFHGNQQQSQQQPEEQVPKDECKQPQQEQQKELQQSPPSPPQQQNQQQPQQVQQEIPLVSETKIEQVKVEENVNQECKKPENNASPEAMIEVKEEKDESRPIMVNPYHDGPEKDVSATTKALEKIDDAMDMKRYIKKKPKMSLATRRRKMNERLNRIISPKSGVMFLHELKPGCKFKINEELRMHQRVFIAEVSYNDKVLATGEGSSKPLAKNDAAENAIRVIVGEAMAQKAASQKDAGNGEEVKPKVEELMETEDLPWAGLASFAMYKMFSQWQNQGTDLHLFPFQQITKKPVVPKPTKPVKKELPPNADQLHPSLLLNSMMPGLVSVELERTSKDNVSFVTMGFEIDGVMYKGSGSNKKEARKEAAKAALTAVYGMKYEG